MKKISKKRQIEKEKTDLQNKNIVILGKKTLLIQKNF